MSLVALANFYPAFMVAADPDPTGDFSLDATGNATGIKNGKNLPPVPASLSIAGSALSEGDDDDDEIKLRDISGILVIGSDTYAISDGKGVLNLKNGKFEIHGKTNGDKKLELILHGYLNGDTAIIQAPQSKLSSMYFLSMTGGYSLSFTTTTETETETETVTVTETVYITIVSNSTVTTTVQEITTTTVISNSTITIVQNVTQTVTETVANSTIVLTTTQTVANTTIVVTTTETVANTTILVTTTETVANTTITVTQTATNSTAP